MTVYLTRRSGALVAIARSAAQQDPLAELTSMLAQLLESCDRIILDLSGVTLAPPTKVAAFLDHVATQQEESGSEIILVVDRLSARRLLRAMSAGEITVVSSVDDAEPTSVVESCIDAPVPADGYDRGPRDTGPSSKS